jgi:hypothetical protein
VRAGRPQTHMVCDSPGTRCGRGGFAHDDVQHPRCERLGPKPSNPRRRCSSVCTEWIRSEHENMNARRREGGGVPCRDRHAGDIEFGNRILVHGSERIRLVRHTLEYLEHAMRAPLSVRAKGASGVSCRLNSKYTTRHSWTCSAHQPNRLRNDGHDMHGGSRGTASDERMYLLVDTLGSVCQHLAQVFHVFELWGESCRPRTVVE